MTLIPLSKPLHAGLQRAAVMVALALGAALAQAADTAPASTPNDPLTGVRAQIAAKDWVGSLAELRRINDATSADWNNLMGYTLRKQRPPELDASEKFYREALRINPKHRGAHEYLGELFLMKGDLKGAEAELSALDKLCFLPCEEHTDLKKAVERFKANGNKYLP